MFKGDRVFIAALAGLILIGASQLPKGDARSGTSQENGQISDALQGIRSALQDANKPDQTTEPCEKEHEKRYSDLCAQWKAADAAADSAKAAWHQILIGWVGLLLGAITMGAAIAAAYFAKKAADHTKTGSDAATAAHESFVASERATIRVRDLIIYETPPESLRPCSHRIKLRVINEGKTTAIINVMQWEVAQGPIFPERPNFMEYRSEFIDAKREIIDLRSMTADDPKDGPVWIMGWLDYTSLGRTYRTHFCYRADFVEDDGYASAHWRTTRSICQNLPQDT